MELSKKCYLELEIFVLVNGWICLLFSSLGIIFSLTLFSLSNDHFISINKSCKRSSFFRIYYYFRFLGYNFGVSVLLIVFIFSFVGDALLIYGTVRKTHLYLLPWITQRTISFTICLLMVLWELFSLIMIIYKLDFDNYNYEGHVMMIIALVNIVLGYVLDKVLALFKEIKVLKTSEDNNNTEESV